MERGYIYELERRKNELGNISEVDFYDKIGELGATYVEDDNSSNVKAELVAGMLSLGALPGSDGTSFIITMECKKNYFANRYADFMNLSKNLTLEEFATSDLYSLRTLIQDDFSDLGYTSENGLLSFDRWLRDAQIGVTWYVGNVVFIH